MICLVEFFQRRRGWVPPPLKTPLIRPEISISLYGHVCDGGYPLQGMLPDQEGGGGGGVKGRGVFPAGVQLPALEGRDRGAM